MVGDFYSNPYATGCSNLHESKTIKGIVWEAAVKMYTNRKGMRFGALLSCIP